MPCQKALSYVVIVGSIASSDLRVINDDGGACARAGARAGASVQVDACGKGRDAG